MYTREQIINKCIEVHGNEYDYSLLPDDIKMSSVVSIICKKHGVFRQSLKNHINNHQGCPECSKENRLNNQKKDGLIKFINASKERFGDKYSFPYIDEEYNGSHSKVTIHCNDCGNEFTKIANDHITSPNGGCKNCLFESKREYYTFDVLNEIKNKEVTIIPFNNKVCKKDLIRCNCPEHGEYKVLVSTILDGRGFCKKCVCKTKLEKTVDIVNQLKEKITNVYNNKFIVDYSTVVSLTSKVRLTCNECGYSFKRSVKKILDNGFIDCARCKSKRIAKERIKTTEEYIKEAQLIYGNIYDYSNTEYISSNKKVKVFCKKCKKEFSIEANSHLQGHGCPYHFCNKSKQEVDILNYVKSIYKGKVYNNDRSILPDKTELDIVIPDKNIAIEFDGLFWHNEINKPYDYHLNKTNLCNDFGIHLIHIFEDEWLDLNKQKIWKSMLKNQLGLITNKIYARKCAIRLVEHKEGYDFLDKNHIQGKCQSTIMYGLYYNNDLVSIMTFGKSRHFIGNGKAEYELLRFCNKTDTLVIGAASKLFNHFLKMHNPKSIVSYADKRWSTGNLYNTLGFELYNESKPNYYYVIGAKRKNRFNFRKSVLKKKYNCPDNMSEHKFCLQNKIYRIYDCGCLCYKFINKLTKKNYN